MKGLVSGITGLRDKEIINRDGANWVRLGTGMIQVTEKNGIWHEVSGTLVHPTRKPVAVVERSLDFAAKRQVNRMTSFEMTGAVDAREER